MRIRSQRSLTGKSRFSLNGSDKEESKTFVSRMALSLISQGSECFSVTILGLDFDKENDTSLNTASGYLPLVHIQFSLCERYRRSFWSTFDLHWRYRECLILRSPRANVEIAT